MIEYLFFIILGELMIYLALRIIITIFLLVRDDEEQVNVTEVTPEEFNEMMKDLFKEDKE